MKKKECSDCKIEFDILSFNSKSPRCKSCQKEYNRIYRESHKQYYKEYKQTPEYKAQQKEYKLKNKQYIKEWGQEYYQKNSDKIKEDSKIYYHSNKEKRNKWEQERRKNNLHIKIRKNVSSAIRGHIKNNYGIKKNSCLHYLPYTIQELKEHLQSKFEPWMNWDNYGMYLTETWKDNDPLTWTWNIDHIVPQSDLSYSSMQDTNFQKCWALENLRPLSSKQNTMDGASRKRHQN